MSEDPRTPFDTHQGDDTPAGDTPEHSEAEHDETGHRNPTHHVGNALGGEGEGSSPGGAPRRHVKRPTPQPA